MFVLIPIKVSCQLLYVLCEANLVGYRGCSSHCIRATSGNGHFGCLEQEVRLTEMVLTGMLADEIRFSNKLVPDKGLALSVYDVWTAEDGKVTWGNGMMYYKGWFSCLPHHHCKLMDSLIQVNAIRPLHWRGHYRQNHINE